MISAVLVVVLMISAVLTFFAVLLATSFIIGLIAGVNNLRIDSMAGIALTILYPLPVA